MDINSRSGIRISWQSVSETWMSWSEAKMYKTDTTHAFLYGDVEEDLFVRAPDWWPELVLEGHCLQLKKNVYGTLQAALAWPLCISGWME